MAWDVGFKKVGHKARRGRTKRFPLAHNGHHKPRGDKAARKKVRDLKRRALKLAEELDERDRE